MPQQERLLEPPRIEDFCPMVHCVRSCGPTDCTCRPCLPGCPFCAERKTAHAPVPFVIQPTFEHRQLRLINDFTAINPRRTK